MLSLDVSITFPGGARVVPTTMQSRMHRDGAYRKAGTAGRGDLWEARGTGWRKCSACVRC